VAVLLQNVYKILNFSKMGDGRSPFSLRLKSEANAYMYFLTNYSINILVGEEMV